MVLFPTYRDEVNCSGHLVRGGAGIRTQGLWNPKSRASGNYQVFVPSVVCVVSSRNTIQFSLYPKGFCLVLRQEAGPRAQERWRKFLSNSQRLPAVSGRLLPLGKELSWF